jgi:hypothetical protein
VDQMAFNGNGYRLGPRVPLQLEEVPEIMIPSLVSGMDSPARALAARADSTTSAASQTCDASNANLCEKPVSSSALTLPIALGVA